MSEERRQQRTCDHRLRELVRETGDPAIATRLGVPRSTAAGWLRTRPQDVISLDLLDLKETQLQAEVLKLRRRIRWLFLNTLDSVAAVRRHMSTYVAAHNCASYCCTSLCLWNR